MLKKILSFLLVLSICIGISAQMDWSAFASSSIGFSAANTVEFLTKYGEKLTAAAGNGTGVRAMVAAAGGGQPSSDEWYFTLDIGSGYSSLGAITYPDCLNTGDGYDPYGTATLAGTVKLVRRADPKTLYPIYAGQCASPFGSKSSLLSSDWMSDIEPAITVDISENGTTKTYQVDVISVLLFLTRVHAMYHSPDAWSELGLTYPGPSTDRSRWSNNGSYELDFGTACLDPACYCLRVLNFHNRAKWSKRTLCASDLMADIRKDDDNYYTLKNAVLNDIQAINTVVPSTAYVNDVHETVVFVDTIMIRRRYISDNYMYSSILANTNGVTDVVSGYLKQIKDDVERVVNDIADFAGLTGAQRVAYYAYGDRYEAKYVFGEEYSNGTFDVSVGAPAKRIQGTYTWDEYVNRSKQGVGALYKVISYYLDSYCDGAKVAKRLSGGSASAASALSGPSVSDIMFRGDSTFYFLYRASNFFVRADSYSGYDSGFTHYSGTTMVVLCGRNIAAIAVGAVDDSLAWGSTIRIQEAIKPALRAVYDGYDAIYALYFGALNGAMQEARYNNLLNPDTHLYAFDDVMDQTLRDGINAYLFVQILEGKPLTKNVAEDICKNYANCLDKYGSGLTGTEAYILPTEADLENAVSVLNSSSNTFMEELLKCYIGSDTGVTIAEFYAISFLCQQKYFDVSKERDSITRLTDHGDITCVDDKITSSLGMSNAIYDQLKKILGSKWDKYLSIGRFAYQHADSSRRKAAFAPNGLSYNSTPKQGTVTVALRAQLDTYASEYEAAKSTNNTKGIPGANTLAVRMKILDLYARYCLPQDALITEVMEQTDMLAGNFEFSATDFDEDVEESKKEHRISAIFNFLDFIEENAFSYDKPYDYFAYQLLLIPEVSNYAVSVYIDLFVDISTDGLYITYKGSQVYVDQLTAIHDVLINHPSVYSTELWTTTLGMGSLRYNAEDDSSAANYEKASDNWETIMQDVEPSLAKLYALYSSLGLINNIITNVDIFDESNALTLLWAISGDRITFDNNWYTGRALSATYVPMQTNLYDPYTMLDYADYEFIEGFHYNYGFNRKALMLDTSPDAAVDYYTTGTSGALRVATLKDLYNAEADIVLYVDTSFYNLTELAERQDKVFDRLSNYDTSPLRQAWNSFTELFGFMHEIDFRVSLKWGETTQYSVKVAENVSGLDWEPAYKTEEDGSITDERDTSEDKFYDDYLLYGGTSSQSNQILTYLRSPEYSPMRGFALVSAIYRDPANFNVINKLNAKPEPIFVSSPLLWCMPNTADDAKNTLFNYALIKNLKAMSTVGYENSMDMTSPLYIDIYGNISTESGAVIVPAACNATLHQSNFQPIATGFLASYGKEWSVPLNTNVDKTFMSDFFIENTKTGVWDIKAQSIEGTSINFAAMSYAEPEVRSSLMYWYLFDLVDGNYIDEMAALRIVHEVMRGAPAEYIDADEENLNPNRNISRMGLTSAAKLDSIINSLNWDEDGSITAIPNMSFIDNYQYVVVFIFKILLVIVVFALMITVFIDSVKQKISWRTLLKCVSTLLVGVSSVLLIPVSFSISYYQSNKLLLQDEASYIVMLNTEKNMSGREIGITEVTEPSNNTKVYLKLEDYKFDWISVLPEVVFGDSINAIDRQYNEFLESSMIANAPNVLCENDGIYMDVQDIFSTSIINFDTRGKQLYQRVTAEPVASYYIPYYYFLDALLWNINKYNSENDIYAYSTKIMAGGYVKTVNLCSAYFNSPEFMDDINDMLGLRQLYRYEGDVYIKNMYTEEAAQEARGSQWYTANFISKDDLYERLDIMDNNVKRWINDNRSSIGRVTDETFIKCLAMDMALKYNALFGIPSASAYEIYNLSNADLIRLVISNREMTLEDSPMSFARFVYDVGGTPAVFAGVFLVVVTMLTSAVRAILTIAIMALLILSVYINKILLRRSNNSVAGYLLTLLVVTGANVIYALVLKLSLAIPQTGLAPTICIILQVIIQLAYIALMVIVLLFALRDWKNFGFTHYQQIGTNIRTGISSFKSRHSKNPQERYDSKPRGVNGWSYLDELEDSFRRKQKKVGKA